VSRILITGGSSYLGQHLVPLAMQTSAHELRYTFYQHDPLQWPQARFLDILDQAKVDLLVREFAPNIIIHTVGSNRGPNISAVIQQGTRHVTNAAAAVGARLIHLSTDVVFNGLQAPYNESSPPSPVNEYGRAKAAAELIVARYENHVIVRTSLIYGLDLMDQGTRWMTQALQSGKPVRLFDNQYRNPIWVETLSQACLELATNSYVGIIHIAGRQVMSRAQFALKMLNWWGVTEQHTLSIGPSLGDYWPLNCELDLGRATAILSTKLLGVDEVLSRFPQSN
jgi:dTDP-4-dehydrorhamnose reductase